MLVLIKPERQTCLGVCGRSTLRWFQIFTLLSLLGACGRVHDTGGSQLASITHEGEEGTLSGHRLAQNILSFSSELRHFAQQDLQVGLSLGSRLFGGRVRANVTLQFTDASGLILKKSPIDGDSRIFVDGTGQLDVRPTEKFTAQCEYASSASLTRGDDFQLSVAGVSAEVEHGVVRLYEAGALGATFDVQAGDSLSTLQTFCERAFAPETAASLHADLQDALTSQVSVRMHADPRVEAMRRLLTGQAAQLHDGGYSWELTPPRVAMRDGQIIVWGEMVRDRFMFDQTFAYKFFIANDDVLTVDAAEIAPNDRGELAFGAQRLATFISRNMAEWWLRSKSGGEMVIQTKMLDRPRPL